MGLHSHEEVTENLFQGFVHNHHVNDINHVIAHKQTSLSVRSGAIFPLPLAYARFAAPVLSHHEKARRRRWLRMSHHRFKVAPVAEELWPRASFAESEGLVVGNRLQERRTCSWRAALFILPGNSHRVATLLS